MLTYQQTEQGTGRMSNTQVRLRVRIVFRPRSSPCIVHSAFPAHINKLYSLTISLKQSSLKGSAKVFFQQRTKLSSLSLISHFLGKSGQEYNFRSKKIRVCLNVHQTKGKSSLLKVLFLRKAHLRAHLRAQFLTRHILTHWDCMSGQPPSLCIRFLMTWKTKVSVYDKL